MGRTALSSERKWPVLEAMEAGFGRNVTNDVACAMSIDGTKIDADASKLRSVRHDRARALRAKLAADIGELVAQAETADQTEIDPQAMPAELVRREALKAKLDAACARMEAERPDDEAKRAAYHAKKGRRRGPPPKPPSDEPPPDQQSNLTDPDSALMRRSMAHELRQAYNAQAVVCAEGTQLILATNLTASPSDAPSFASTILGMEQSIGLPRTVLADAGFASGPAVANLTKHGVEPLVAIGRMQPHRPHDFRPPPEPKKARRVTEPWRIAMMAKPQTDDAKALCSRRKHTVEPVFGIIISVLGFRRFRLRGLRNVATEGSLIALAYNCGRLNRLQAG